MPTLSPGARFGAYRLIRPLGKGGFAEVWEAEHEANGRRVALKVLTELRAESARALERFEQEGRLAASLSSPRCVYVFDAGEHDGSPYIAMELVPGGTLADRIQHGPLPPREAVDVVLDVLDGLESAQQAGILHRDVKPSNVFLDADGRAKIGDFGISKSLEVDSKLSQTGAFLGTPYYASPEQIAGEPLDLRSDLYSVGAMLYELVTGKLPYQGTTASAVLAQVLTRDPVPFAEHGVPVPPGLQRVILRCLAKPKEKRFQSYAQLRAALLPLSSRGLAPAGLTRRFGAIMVDVLLFLPLGVALGTLELSRGVPKTGVEGVVALLRFVYFTLTERYWGGSVGKQLLGLRVTSADGTTPSLGRVTWRTAVFLLIYGGPALLATALAPGGLELAAHPLVGYVPGLLRVLGIGALLSTMRRRNGYGGLHELASGTRVMELLAGERAGAVPRAAPPLEPLAEGAAYGPYLATGTLWRDQNEALLVARDDELHRDVWIHEIRDTAAPPVERLRARGEGSLPWLQRGARDGVTWDAYGAPQGTPLERWAVERGGLAWREMREVLLSLAREVESRCARDGTAGPLSPRHVWVDLSGRALLLDFPARPGTAADDAAQDVTAERAGEFVSRVAALGFQGRAVLPEYARVCMAGLSGSAALGEFRATLERLASRPAEVSRARRAGPLAVLAVVAALVVAVRLAIPAMMASLPGWYRDVTLNGDSYLAVLRRADSLSSGPAADSARRTAAAVQVMLAAAAQDVRAAPQGATLLGALPAPLRAALDSAARRSPAPDSQAVADARARLAAAHVGLAPGGEALRGGLVVVPKAVLQSFTMLAYLGIGGVVLALLLRGGFLLRLFGIGVVRTDGTPAGRLRCAARSLIAWSPLLLLLAFAALPGGVRFTVQPSAPVSVSSSAGPQPGKAPTPLLPPWMRWALGTVAVAGAGYAVWRPSRGVAERVSGVVLVPR